jgi:hypothetical protein
MMAAYIDKRKASAVSGRNTNLVVLKLVIVAALASLAESFAPRASFTSTTTAPATFKIQHGNNDELARCGVCLKMATSPPTKNGEGNILQTSFSGGAWDKQEDYEQEAFKLASKLKSVKNLGWKGTAKRPGSTRPRHRAWGGSSEQPVQFKANYDESNPNCVEAWLTQSDFEKCVGVKESSPASDTVFVALAKGAAFAERDVCEETIASWYPSGSSSRSIDPGAFWASVKKGRTELAIGWSVFIGFNVLAASCIILPTNPLAKGLERAVEAVLHAQ